MNIEIANRLVNLRKKSGLSQEELAAKLGLSRQAVSKWERAEASPDTDNLICLAKLYGVSLDDLLNTNESIEDIIKEQEMNNDASTMKSNEENASSNNNEKSNTNDDNKEDHKTNGFHADFSGIHFGDGEDEGEIGTKGIHVHSKDGSYVHIDKNGIHVREKDGECFDSHCLNSLPKEKLRRRRYNIANSITSGSITFLAIIGYILFGCLYPDTGFAWSTGWLMFLLIPISASFVSALKERSFCAFAFPVLVTGGYLLGGLAFGVWHPTWVLFLFIPLYYIVFGPIDHAIHQRLSDKFGFHFKGDHGTKDDDDDDDDDDVVIDAR